MIKPKSRTNSINNFLPGSKSVTLKGDESLKRIGEKSGVYIIRCMENNKPKKFARLNKPDELGILYIGKSVNLRKRIGKFFKDIEAEGSNKKYHSAGRTFRQYFRDNEDALIKLDKKNMEIFWKVVNDEDKSDRLETDLLHYYVSTYLDKPPLNISIKRKR